MNATAQAYPPAARMIPESIAKALDSAAAAVKCPRRRDEEGHPFFDAEDVVPRCASAFRYYKLKLIAVSWSLAPIGSLIAVHRAGVIQSLEDGAELPVSTTWLVNLRDLPPGPAINAALTQSMAALYRVALELVTGDVEERPAPTRPITDSTSLGVSSRSKQSPSGARMSRQREEQSRERVDPEAVKAELDKAAREAFSEGSSGLAAHVDPDPTMPPTNAICVAHGVKGCAPCWGDELNPAIKDSGASSPESASVGTVPAEAPQPDKGNGSTSPPAACKSGPESTSSATSTDGATSTDLIQPTPSQVKAVDFLDQGEWAGLESTSGTDGVPQVPPSPSVPGGLKCASCGKADSEAMTECTGCWRWRHTDACMELYQPETARTEHVWCSDCIQADGVAPPDLTDDEVTTASKLLDGGATTRQAVEAVGGRLLSAEGGLGILWARGESRWRAKVQTANKWLRGQTESDELVPPLDPVSEPSPPLKEEDWAPDSRLVPLIQTPADSSGTATLTVESSKAPPVLAKRTAESKAGKWAKATKRKARKAALCAECHGQIPAKAEHWDLNGKRCCLSCRANLEKEAA